MVLPLNDRTRIRICLPVQSSKKHGYDDAGEKQQTTPSDAGPKPILQKRIKTTGEKSESKLTQQQSISNSGHEKELFPVNWKFISLAMYIKLHCRLYLLRSPCYKGYMEKHKKTKNANKSTRRTRRDLLYM